MNFTQEQRIAELERQVQILIGMLKNLVEYVRDIK